MVCGYSLSHTVHLISAKANAIFAEMLTAWKNRCKKKNAIKIVNYDEKEILLLTNEENDSYSKILPYLQKEVF